ncbi:MAG TPA: hypothetical protein GX733_09220 [Tissierellia bacterium]|jgi:ketosteroid isomerase-like protein|nr:hypothetical protein [Tissierellia bacterium]
MYKQKLEEAKKRRIEALQQADVEAYINGYDEKGVILLDRGQIVRGKEALREQMDNFITLLGSMHHVLETEAYWPDEEGVVTEKGRFSYSQSLDEQPFYTGVYIYVWKEQPNGEYLLLRELHIDD